MQLTKFFYLLSFNSQSITCEIETPPGRWQKILDSADLGWNGPGSSLPTELQSSASVTLTPTSFALYKA
ncbi:MAG: hypothetical protein HC790_13755 [Acaryochloridaceae cyanobacterium CSU_3_4]|nr:hypothetical protein [Acaryochloridaceae cyanobacterium CSU_3_4]